MAFKYEILKQTYFDSVTLMLINTEIKKCPGVDNAVVGMGTDFNLQSIKRLNLWLSEFDSITPSDLIICVCGKDEKALPEYIEKAKGLLKKKITGSGGSALKFPTLSSAMKSYPDSNIALISVPGTFAAREADNALDNGLHVMLFSDNVTVEDELRLKQKAVSKGLLVMGPDCGTAIINNIPLAFANVVRKGNIGLVAASGTGLQEVTCVIDKLDCGISQAIGVGGRDLSEKIGGLMTIASVKALAEDPATNVIVLISKPPAESTLPKLFSQLKDVKKPVVIYFIGADPSAISSQGFTPAENLEDAGKKACELATGKKFADLITDEKIASMAAKASISKGYVRALYSGGTLCDEAQRFLMPVLGEISSNTPVKGVKKCNDLFKSTGHCVIDLGDDDYTRGKAHPMIDPMTRKERIISETADPETSLIILDLVMGWGSHPDMASELSEAITLARHETKRNPIFAVTICGTVGDPQSYQKQWETMEKCGAYVFPTNISMLKFVRKILMEGRK
ncbi:MAG: acyl-CoA synthetase FdrA [Candidatus Riflebacteria bacterium]|nr:acyl-CoA synthetase FdrA [Candidatus Riflebacteria bacterium]